MDYKNPDALVSTEWLAEHLDDENLVVVDATWYPRHSPRSGRGEFARTHIPGARFFDIDDIADPDTHLPHMLPDASTFAAKVGALGIGDGDRVVTYDASGGAAAGARAWWMFRVFGHGNVAVLSGGLGKWLEEGRPIETGEPLYPAKSFTVRTVDGKADSSLVRSAEDLLANVNGNATEQVIDARGASRFAGSDPEPWPVIKVGHIPGSRNLPFPTLMDFDQSGVIRSADEISAAVTAAGVDMSCPVVTSCGSGVTAAILTLGLHLIGHDRVAMYDGSWSDWGSREDTPVEQG